MKKSPAKKKAPRAPKVKGKYVATIVANEQEFKASGATALEAMKGLTMPPFMLKTKAYLHLDFSRKTASQMMLAIQLRRFLNNKTAREIQAKRLESRLA